MIYATSTGDFSKTEKALNTLKSDKIFKSLASYGQRGVDALSSATPVDTGDTAGSWKFQTGFTNGKYSITWLNTNNEGGVNVAILIQYGHGTGTGGYVAGRDFINPAMRPVFDHIVEDLWRQVTNA
jgi:hypothetical protein